MPEGQVLEFSGLTKRFGAVTAVDDFTARVEPGVVTGFLGPNGAGKTTTLRMLLGLVRPTSGTATIGGLAYEKLPRPLSRVGAALEASSFHPGRSAANHLKVYAQAAELPTARVDEALGLVGLADVAGRKVGGFSLGMRQRLGLAFTLLGDPGVLVLDEPANGLDPEGIKWMRGLLRQLARQGRTVLVSSHLLAEVQQTVDALLIVSRGRLVFEGSLDELSADDEQSVIADAIDRTALADALRAAGIEFEILRAGLSVRGTDAAAVGAAALAGGVALTTLHRRGPALEEIFLDLVNGVRVHASSQDAVGAPVADAPDGSDAEVADPAAASAPVSETAATATDVADAEAPAGADSDEDVSPFAALVADEDAVAASGADSELDADSEPGAAQVPDEDSLAAPAADPATGADAAPDVVADADATSEGNARERSFAVAGTGVIDVVPVDEDPPPEANAADRSFSVAGTGVIDVVSTEAAENGIADDRPSGFEAPETDDEGDE